MKPRYRIALAVLIAVGAIFLVRALVGGSLVALFTPRGSVASQERDVIIESVAIMLLVAVPMLTVLYAFAWKYRADNKRAVYDPDATHTPWSELAMWAIPAAAVAILGTIAWQSAHALDPYQRIRSSTPPITIQVVALPWKWLFIYPAQQIATVNEVDFPVGTPVHFELTADAPMSSFWIPQLGSQIYAMAAMQTQLNLIASATGTFPGRDTEINGDGYAGMTFMATALTPQDFDAWVSQVKQSPQRLDASAYAELAKPSSNVAPEGYAWSDPSLYGTVLMKDMMPATTTTAMPPDMPGMPGMHM